MRSNISCGHYKRISAGMTREQWLVYGQGYRGIVASSQTGSGAPPKPLLQWVLEAASPEVKRQKREADHSPDLRPELRMSEAIHTLPHMPSWRTRCCHGTTTYVTLVVDVVSCSPVDKYVCFGRTWCLYSRGWTIKGEAKAPCVTTLRIDRSPHFVASCERLE